MKTLSQQTFDAPLIALGENKEHVTLAIPFDVLSVYGTQTRVPVYATLDGYTFRTWIKPYQDAKGHVQHYLVMRREMRDAINKQAGESVCIIMQLDTDERVVDVPDDFQMLLDNMLLAKQIFDGLSYTHRREYVHWINDAATLDARTKRMWKVIALLTEGKSIAIDG